jgi:hypothetical protein
MRAYIKELLDAVVRHVLGHLIYFRLVLLVNAQLLHQTLYVHIDLFKFIIGDKK